jgi:hypothetical protein
METTEMNVHKLTAHVRLVLWAFIVYLLLLAYDSCTASTVSEHISKHKLDERSYHTLIYIHYVLFSD